MPELPEVETIRRSLLPELIGRRIAHVRYNRADIRFPLPIDMPAQVQGKTIMGLERRGKYLLMRVEDAGEVLIHLGMSGRLLIEDGNQANTAGEYYYDIPRHIQHDHVVFELKLPKSHSDLAEGKCPPRSEGGKGGASPHNKKHLIYNDPRRFGVIDFIPLGQNTPHPLLANMGLEPWDDTCTAEWFFEISRNRTTSLKAFVLDQNIIAGIGNIYASEALHIAHLSPFRTAGSLTTPETTLLLSSIRNVLEKGIRLGGASIRDFQNSDGSSGRMQDEFLAYGRDGSSCTQCSGVIEKMAQNGRSTFWCKSCQV